MKESLEILRMKKLAGLLTEGEYAKALLREEASNKKYKVKLLVPKVYFNVETGEFSDYLYDFGAKSELKDMDITNYSNGTELDNVVFSNDLETAEEKAKEYPKLFKIVYLDEALLREMEGDIFDYSNLVLGTINRLIDMEEKGENILNILGRISEWNELVDLAREEVGDLFDYSNLVLGTINQLINMGEKGQSVLNILGRISEWNEVVDLAREA
jgi:hypothetical protein